MDFMGRLLQAILGKANAKYTTTNRDEKRSSGGKKECTGHCLIQPILSLVTSHWSLITV
jgi:hypothetical protein